jgi:hypothetical protein
MHGQQLISVLETTESPFWSQKLETGEKPMAVDFGIDEQELENDMKEYLHFLLPILFHN